MEDNQAFGKWCKKQEFKESPNTLHSKLLAWKEFSAHAHDQEQKINDYNIWRRIAGLNHVQKKVIHRPMKLSTGR